jgi:hypothetical protein
MNPADIPALTILRITLQDGRTIEGEMNHTCGIAWLHTKGKGETYTFDASSTPCVNIEVLKTLDQVLQERHERKFGAKAYQDPTTRDEFEATLWDLAKQSSDLAIAYNEAGGFLSNQLNLIRRSDQLKAQFHEVADRIDLAKTKRSYMLATSQQHAKGLPMPSPWEITSSAIDAMMIDVPKASDFDPDPKQRRKRGLKPPHGYEPRGMVEWSMQAAATKARTTKSASKRKQMLRIVAKREAQLRQGLYREAIEAQLAQRNSKEVPVPTTEANHQQAIAV